MVGWTKQAEGCGGKDGVVAGYYGSTLYGSVVNYPGRWLSPSRKRLAKAGVSLRSVQRVGVMRSGMEISLDPASAHVVMVSKQAIDFRGTSIKHW